MKLSARKICNSCRKTVAYKQLVGYRTIEDYVTVLQRDTPIGSDDRGDRNNLHYCCNCWSSFQRAIRKDMELRAK